MEDKTERDSNDLVMVAKRMRAIQVKLAEIDEVRKPLQKELDEIRNKQLPDLMDDIGIGTVQINGVGKIVLHPMMSVKQPTAKVEFFNFLRDRGAEDLIAGTVNSSTLNAWVREQVKQHSLTIEEVQEYCEVNTWTQARIVGANKAR